MQTPVTPAETLEKQSFFDIATRHPGATIFLGAVALAAHKMQLNNVMIDWYGPLREAGESMKHPVLGYLGAAIGNIISPTRTKVSRVCHILGWATITNFTAEYAQALASPYTPETNFLASRNHPETVKDFGFAIFGIGLFALNERHLQRKFRRSQDFS